MCIPLGKLLIVQHKINSRRPHGNINATEGILKGFLGAPTGIIKNGWVILAECGDFKERRGYESVDVPRT